MISHGHGNDPYSQSGCGARGEAAKIQAHGGDWPFYAAGMSGHVWARAEADAEADAEGRYRNVLVRFSGCVVP
jgi:hypothetical protein